MKKVIIVFMSMLLILSLAACGNRQNTENSIEEPTSEALQSDGSGESEEETTMAPQEELYNIRITAGDTTLYGTLYDNQTARDFADQLPLTIELWEPADFAKAFYLDERISDEEPVTRLYEVGGLAYWPAGAAVAIFYSGHRDRTVVPVITIGKIDEGAEMFETYSGEITIELE